MFCCFHRKKHAHLGSWRKAVHFTAFMVRYLTPCLLQLVGYHPVHSNVLRAGPTRCQVPHSPGLFGDRSLYEWRPGARGGADRRGVAGAAIRVPGEVPNLSRQVVIVVGRRNWRCDQCCGSRRLSIRWRWVCSQSRSDNRTGGNRKDFILDFSMLCLITGGSSRQLLLLLFFFWGGDTDHRSRWSSFFPWNAFGKLVSYRYL